MSDIEKDSVQMPLGLADEDTADKKNNHAVDSLVKDNPRGNKANQDDSQHMKKMRNKLILFAGANSLIKHQHQKTFNKAVKQMEHAEASVKAASNKPGASGSYGRSISEIFAEDELKKQKKHLEKLQKKWPNLQRPQSMRENISRSTRTIFSGINQALRAQTMKGVAQSQGGSDTKAMTAAAAFGYIPGADSAVSDDFSL